MYLYDHVIYKYFPKTLCMCVYTPHLPFYLKFINIYIDIYPNYLFLVVMRHI